MKWYLKAIYGALLLMSLPVGEASAAPVWVRGVEVTQLGTYHRAAHHFVWFSVLPAGCSGTPVFSQDEVGGKALYATLTTALVGKRKVDVQLDGCDIVEVYLK